MHSALSRLLLACFTGFVLSSTVSAQTLAAGDIALIGHHTDAPDGFTWIALTDIPAGEVIYFAEDGWCSAGPAWYVGPNEGHITWTAPGGGTPCGTITNINESATPDVFTVTGSGTAVISSGVWNLSGGDQIIAYQSSTGPKPAVPSFIAACHGDYNALDYNAITTWNAGASCINTSSSGVPTGLTNGVDCVSIFPAPGPEFDNAKYTGTLTGTSAALRALINNPANWTTFSDAPISILPSTYPVPAVTCVSPSPEIDIEGNGTSIADGDVTPTVGDDTEFGTVALGATNSHTFTIQNEGAASLTLTGTSPNYVTITGTAFTITTQPSSGSIAVLGSETFVVQFAPTCSHSGTETADVTVTNDDGDESSYTFRVQGTVSSPDADGDGINDCTDIDDDNDGLTDVTEGGGTDPSGDADSDGIFNYEDTDFAGYVDANSDLINDNFDFDLDGIPNHLDVDSDNDGIGDGLEANGGTVPSNYDNATGTFTGPVGTNGMPDNAETAPDNGISTLSNPNTDATGNEDYLDTDSDDDGLSDNVESMSVAGYVSPLGTDADLNGRDDNYDGAGAITPVNTDGLGNVDYRDLDSDNDGVGDASDADNEDFNICEDADGDGCDDCSITNDGFGPLADNDPLNDGTDSDCDGICDSGDLTDGASQTRGNMLVLNGSDYLSIGNVAELNFGKTDDFTVEAWISTSSGSSAMQIISKYEGDLFNATGWGFQISGSSLAFYMAGGSLFDFMVSVPAGTPNLKDGLWHHVAVVYDGSNHFSGCTFYIDGIPFAGIDGGGTVATVAGTVANTESATIGAYEGTISGAGEYWVGSLEEVRVWDDQRTQTEIRENIHLSLSGGCDASNVGAWKFNETSGAIAFDLSGNSNDATYKGTPTSQASTAAVGDGISVTHPMTAPATTYSTNSITTGYSMDLSFATIPPGGEVVVFNLYGKPVGGIPGPAAANHDWHYWIVNNYGPTNSGLDGTATFNYVDGGVVSTTLSDYELYKRGSREFGSWTQNNAAALGASNGAGNNFISFDGLASFSQLMPISTDVATPLGVELLDFTATLTQDNAVLLEWSTASEFQNKGFEIQRSTDGFAWEMLGFVEGSGTKNSTTRYNFKDYLPYAGINYYRFVQVDENGATSTSPTRRIELKEHTDFTLYPNPNKGEFVLQFNQEEFVEGMQLEVYDATGRIVAKQVISSKQHLIQLEAPTPGVYFIRVIATNTTRLLRFVVH